VSADERAKIVLLFSRDSGIRASVSDECGGAKKIEFKVFKGLSRSPLGLLSLSL
jgi:hypothetical protein